MDSMDTRTVTEEEVRQHIAEIKTHMPETYKEIQTHATEIGRQAFAMVRAGLRGEPNRFWAVERGWVKGCPFNLPAIAPDIAQSMVAWGSSYVCIFGQHTQGEQINGTN